MTSSRRRRRVSGVFTVLAAAGVLSGCAVTAHPHYAYGPVKSPSAAVPSVAAHGTTQAKVSAVALVRRVRVAPAVAVASRTARFTIQVTAAAAQGTASVGGSGALDFRRNVGTASLDLSSVTTDGAQLDMVQTPHAVYMHLPPAARGQFGGRPWVMVDLRAAARRLGISADTLADQSRQADARSYLDALRGVASLHVAGAGSIRDVPTTHYAGRITVARVAKSLPPSMRSRVRAVLGPGDVRVDAWLDHSGRPRRIEERFAVSHSIQLDAIVDFFDYGVPVHVSIPSPSEVTDITSIVDK